MRKNKTISDIIQAHDQISPAIFSPGRPPISYGQLNSLVQNTISKLNAFGINRNDRVAIIIPNGPEMATAFISVSSGATAAPLNPNYRTEEYEFYLSDLNANALIVQSGENGPAVMAAKNLGIQVINLIPENNSPAGTYNLHGNTCGYIKKKQKLSENDIALILHTSGTTSKPKIVPLSHKNIITSAHNISSSLRLNPNDKCLNIMPLFHIHGLIGAILSSLYAGASISCTPGFNALSFFSWLDSEKPTWYTAVPTMHQAILSRAERNKETVSKNILRFVRSSSASLPPAVMNNLEKTFNTSVIESYGMTEASHQMTSNPLPPGKRIPGSVGLASGPEVEIMNESGEILSPNKIGEVVIKGNNVTSGYENNINANISSFIKRWFRTGDQGYIDNDGYLYLTGRLKEIINRGGEKISPYEIDNVLQQHPSIHQAVTFSVPHKNLGEDVAAVVVLNPHKQISETELKHFLSKKLSDFKIPNKILFVEEIPKGATGKLQRMGLAKKLELI
ncbi:MAG: AMP-dependent synthetase [Rhodospirillaceae bacterium]|nr:AMP-dependent synthetase [Rhodospirillaceae bacterium]